MQVRFLDAVFRAERNEVDVVTSAFQISIRATPLCLLEGVSMLVAFVPGFFLALRRSVHSGAAPIVVLLSALG